MGHFLLVVRWTQVSISIRFRDIWRYAYWGHDLKLSVSRDVISHVTIRINQSINQSIRKRLNTRAISRLNRDEEKHKNKKCRK